MAEATLSRQALVEAIAVLESHRGAGGNGHDLDRSVQIGLHVLRERLADLQAASPARHQLAVLVADLSGFTALSERMDAEQVREALNAMWQELDAVIQAWGGQVDQHAGDSLLALFGAGRPRPSDVERALHAALALQLEMDLFNRRVRDAAGSEPGAGWAGNWPGPQMRIGVHAGPVYFAPGAGAGKRTVVGDTILTARWLEKVAPPGQVLASDAVYERAQGRFLLTPAPFHEAPAADALPAWQRDGQTYVVRAERADDRLPAPAAVVGRVARAVGRAAELDQLELALQVAADSRAPQLVVLVGEPGSGKSRLVYEFESRARLLGSALTVLRAGRDGLWSPPPYALVRDLLRRRFGIRPQHGQPVVEEKLRRALVALGQPPEAAGLLAQLLDVRRAGLVNPDAVLRVILGVLEALAATGPTLLILENIQRADRQSLELADRLLQAPGDLPLLIVGLAESSEPDASGPAIRWLEREDDPFSPLIRVDVGPLSPVDARLLATDLLSPIAPPPMRLLDLVVAESRGNPLYIEEFVRLLVGAGSLETGERWRVDMSTVEALRLPPGLRALLHARLAQMPPVERHVLQTLAVMGQVGWDAALAPMGGRDDLSDEDLAAALASLVDAGLLARDPGRSFGDAEAYAFTRSAWRDATYATLAEEQRVRAHQRAASWLIALQSDAIHGAWFPAELMIVWHFAQAGDDDQAAAWRARAHRHGGKTGSLAPAGL